MPSRSNSRSSDKKTLQKKNNVIKELRKKIKELDRRLDTLNGTIMDEFDNREVVSKRLDNVFTDLHSLTHTMTIVKEVLKERGVNWANYGISHHQNIPRETTSTQSGSRRRRTSRV